MWLPTNPLAPVTRIVDIGVGSGGAVAVSDAITHCSHLAAVRGWPIATRDSRRTGRRPYHRPMTHLDARTLRALTHAMPKAELHLHLDGSLRVDTALDIARTRDVDAPVTFAGMRAVLVGPEQVTDQAELLLAFDLPIALMQDAEAVERDRGGPRRGQGLRQRPLHGDPLGAAAPHAQGPDGTAGRRGGVARARTGRRGGTAWRSG